MSVRTARDVIDAVTYFENDNMGMSNETTIGETFGADAILSALDAAGFAVVPKSLLAKVQNDPPMTGLMQFDLTAKGIET